MSDLRTKPEYTCAHSTGECTGSCDRMIEYWESEAESWQTEALHMSAEAGRLRTAAPCYSEFEHYSALNLMFKKGYNDALWGMKRYVISAGAVECPEHYVSITQRGEPIPCNRCLSTAPKPPSEESDGVVNEEK